MMAFLNERKIQSMIDTQGYGRMTLGQAKTWLSIAVSESNLRKVTSVDIFSEVLGGEGLGLSWLAILTGAVESTYEEVAVEKVGTTLLWKHGAVKVDSTKYVG